MKKLVILCVPVAVCLFSAFLAARLQAESLAVWYPSLSKSPLTPPNIFFPVVWTLLYISMGLSIGLIHTRPHPQKALLTVLFAAQLAVNFAWSLVFFVFQQPLAGFWVIILLEALILWYAVRAYPVYRPSSVLFWPYIVWVGFAGYLNLYIALHNG